MLVSRLSSSYLSPLNNTYEKIEKESTVKEAESKKSAESTQSKDSKLEETIIEMAKKDASQGVYMGAEYRALSRKCVSEVSPNRSLAIAQVSNLMRDGHKKGYDLVDGINRWISMLLDLPYKAEVNIEAGNDNDTAQIYDQNGEMIAAYGPNGWTSVPTSAENACEHELRFAYFDAYCKAREAMKAGDASGTLFSSQA